MSNPPMQPIKFRAVDPETGQASTIDFLKFSLGRWTEESNHQDLQVNFSFFEGFTFPNPVRIGDLRNLILCQFTGLTDYSGQEVYAGDVLMLGSFLYVAEWAADLCGYSFMALPKQPGMELIYTSIDAHEVASSRLVGNIWEPDEALRKRAIEIKMKARQNNG